MKKENKKLDSLWLGGESNRMIIQHSRSWVTADPFWPYSSTSLFIGRRRFRNPCGL